MKDGSGLDISELFEEIRHLRIQLEKTIENNNSLRQKLEELSGEDIETIQLRMSSHRGQENNRGMITIETNNRKKQLSQIESRGTR